MKQRMVIKVQVNSDKCRSKALKIAAVSKGVVSLSLEGESNDELVVTGEGVDAVCLTNKIGKKFRYATLVSLEDVEDSEEGGDDKGDESRQEDESTTNENSPLPWISLPPCVICESYLPPCLTCESYLPPPYHNYYPPNSCSIL